MTRLATRARTPLVLAAIWVAGACVSAPGRYVQTEPTTASARMVEGGSLAGAVLPGFLARSLERGVRIRSRTCGGLGVGSGFFVDDHTIVTNAHVVAGYVELSIEEFDGRALTIREVFVAPDVDLAAVTIAGAPTYGPPPRVLEDMSAPGTAVWALGYPSAGALELRAGRIVDRVSGDEFEQPGEILRSTVQIEPGNSGGPLLDASGAVVGVNFAVELANGMSLAIPAVRLSGRASWSAVSPAGC